MSQQQLSRQLERVAQRSRRYRLLRRLSICWLLAALLGVGLLAAEVGLGVSIPAATPLWLAAIAMTGIGMIIAGRGHRSDQRTAARMVERTYPDLKQRLLAAIEQRPDLKTGRLNFLQYQVIHEALAHGDRHDWQESVPTRRLARVFYLHWFSVVVLLCVMIGLFVFGPGRSERVSAGTSEGALAAGEYGLIVEPGHTEVERGTGLLVWARFQAAVPGEVLVTITSPDGGIQKIELDKSLDDPIFGGRIPQIEQDLTYRIEFDGHATEEFQVAVFDYPELQTANATVMFPEYTSLPETVVKDARQISLVEGSTVRLDCRVNKPLAAARLLDDEGRAIALEEVDGDPRSYRVALQPQLKRESTTLRYRLELTDSDGRHNKSQPEFTIDVVPNQRPELKLAFPARDLRVSPLEEVALEATAWDDFGLNEYGVIYTVAGKEPVEHVLGESVAAKANHSMEHMLALEQLQVEPDQLVSYYFFAEDVGPDGQPRRTFSDMFFAEVRPFEEIFRQGQQQPPSGGGQQGGGGQQAQQAEQLAELQKQIVNATWKLIRRETAATPSQEFPSDVAVIRDSQNAAQEQARQLAEKLTDAKSRALIDTIINHMQQAAQQLTSAAEDGQVAPLTPALAQEQAAYQALLQLRAREHNVVRGQQNSGGGGGGSSRSQQQMQQLELSNDRDRYETQRQASASGENEANREVLQALNRLRELARRQGDLNRRLKELEMALREAKTEPEKEEIRRQLKRLREEQQKLLRDLDELRNRMNRPENQAEMAESRQQLDQTRERVLQSSEALEQGQTSQALTAGTRAERELQQLRDDFRKKAAGQFDDAMKVLRNQARELAREQEALSEQLDSMRNPESRTLRTARQRDEIEQKLQEQQEQLSEILQQSRDIVRESETSEPLLSKQLYETIRETRKLQPEKALEMTEELLRRGLVSQTGQIERRARQGIDELKQGVEQAAEGILGDELEALRRARDELDDLAQAVEGELSQADSADSAERANHRRGMPGGSADSAEEREIAPQSGSRSSEEETEPMADSEQDRNPDASRDAGQSPTDQSQAGNSASRNGSDQPDDSNSPAQQGSSSSSASRTPSDANSSAGESSSSPPQSDGGRPSLRRGRDSNERQTGGLPSFFTEDGWNRGPGGPGGPLTGEEFQQWSDRMRDVEEMLEDPKLRAQVAEIRERARSMRVEFKRHSKEPQWPLVRTTIFEPLVELRRHLAEDIARKRSQDALVPLDRDPVPKRYEDLVRRYYEQLGSGK